MPKSQRYEQAKEKLCAAIRAFFPDGEEKDGQWWWRRRAERTPSCHLVDDGPAIHDFGDPDFRGSVLDAYAESQGIDIKQAVDQLLGAATTSERKKKERIPAQLPIPAEALKALNAFAKSGHILERQGDPVKGWTYRDTAGEALFAVVRYEKDGKKAILPFYFGTDNAWHQGQAYTANRPLYGLERLSRNEGSSVLVVEGEKCADISVAGYVVVTWPSGSSAVTKADWSVLSHRDVVVWPDNDSPGNKAAAIIGTRLPGCKMLRIPDDKAEGWDLADAAQDGIDIPAFISENLQEGHGPDNRPYIPLGYDSTNHWFLHGDRRIPYHIPLGQFSGSKLGELAPVAWWSQMNFVTDQGSIKTAAAQDYVVGESTRIGSFSLDNLRGVGVWMDRGRVIINAGDGIVLMDGERIDYREFDGEAVYTASDETQFGDMTGSVSTDAEGALLAELFEIQEFATRLQEVAALGWSLIAPFGGLLAWRPNVWVTGRKGAGKSWVLRAMSDIVGPFTHRGSGKDTEAGIRRSLNLDARPVILDETEARNKRERDNITGILTLIRNSAGEGSGYVTMAQGDGVRRYLIRSCFCVASVNVPEADAAQASRFVLCEIKRSRNEQAKVARSQELKRELLITDPARFRRRIFRALPQILEDIEYLRKGLAGMLSDQRLADLYAPLLAAAWAVRSRESIDCEAGVRWQGEILDDLVRNMTAVVEDEDRVIEQILAGTIRMDGAKNRTVTEMLRAAEDDGLGEPAPDAIEHLSRLGIALREIDGRDVIAIARGAEQIKRMLVDTPYVSDYDAPLRRNTLCLNPDEPKQMTMAMGRPRCRLFEWAAFRDRYMGARA